MDEPRPAPVGRLVARALRRARAVGRRLVPLDRRPRLRPRDRPRQLGRLLPALPARRGGRSSILPGPMELWGSLLSTALFGAALCLLYRITLGRYDEAMARRTVLYLSIFPLAFVFSLPYAESLFLLLALGAFALTWHGRGVGRRGGRRAGGARAAGRDRAPARARLADVPAARAAAAAVPAAAAPAARRAAVLRVPGLAHGRLPGQRPCPGARLGARRRRACRTCSATRSGTT